VFEFLITTQEQICHTPDLHRYKYNSIPLVITTRFTLHVTTDFINLYRERKMGPAAIIGILIAVGTVIKDAIDEDNNNCQC
jgi:hypothetical protein